MTLYQCIATFCVLVVILLVGGCVSQKSVLYQPGHYGLGSAKSIAAQEGLSLWPTPTSSYSGLVGNSPVDSPTATVVVFHGNSGIAAFRSYYVSALQRLGCRVILAEYPGYGGRPGDMSEKAFAADATRILEQAEKEFGHPLFVWGESLGAAVAAAAVRKGARPDGVVMLTPWDTLRNVARAHFPSWVVSLSLRDEYDNISGLEGFDGPIAVVLAEMDDVIPTRFGHNLYKSLHGGKRLWVMPGVGHNDWPTGPSNPMWDEVLDFLAGSPDSESGS